MRALPIGGGFLFCLRECQTSCFWIMSLQKDWISLSGHYLNESGQIIMDLIIIELQ